jgi:adenine-specific DNA methylase
VVQCLGGGAAKKVLHASLTSRPFGQQKSAHRSERFLLNSYSAVDLPAATAAASATVATASAATTAVTAATAAVAAAATTVAAAATAITAATTAAASATVATAATWRASFTWASFVHGERTAFDRLAVELADRLLRIGVGRHRHKREAARFTGKLILHQRDLLHRASLSEKILQIRFGRVEGKISYV